jgi:hypothetical protein
MAMREARFSAYRSDPAEVLFEVRVGDRRRAVIAVPGGYAPESRSGEAITWFWAGSWLYAIDSADVLQSRDIGDDVLAVIPFESGGVVVSETAVRIIATDFHMDRVVFDHNEVITGFERDGRDLVVSDFAGKSIRLEGVFPTEENRLGLGGCVTGSPSGSGLKK